MKGKERWQGPMLTNNIEYHKREREIEREKENKAKKTSKKVTFKKDLFSVIKF